MLRFHVLLAERSGGVLSGTKHDELRWLGVQGGLSGVGGLIACAEEAAGVEIHPGRFFFAIRAGSSGSPRCVRTFRIDPGSVMNAMSRMSPPHPGHAKGNSSPTRAMSFAQAIREVS